MFNVTRRKLARKLATAARLGREKGLYFILRRALCRLIYPRWLYSTFLKGRRFTFEGERLPYFYHGYNTAWRNERTVEIPIFARVLQQYRGKRVLEVGNVTRHYLPGVTHDVLDKYERAAGVINEDVVGFGDEATYDLIFSISTLEHVGWDEQPRDPRKVLAAIANLKRLLKPGGLLVYSVPLNYHPPLDEFIRAGEAGPDTTAYLARQDQFNTWRQVPATSSLAGVKFNDPYAGASAIVVRSWRKPVLAELQGPRRRESAPSGAAWQDWLHGDGEPRETSLDDATRELVRSDAE